MAKMPHARKWQHILSSSYGSDHAALIIATAHRLYSQYLRQHLPGANRSRRAELKARILPGLSVYKAFLELDGDQERALVEMDPLFRAVFFNATARGIRLLSLLPEPFPVIRPALKWMTRNEYLLASQEVVEDSANCFAVNVYRCFIFDTLAQHHAAELTALYCSTDDWLAEILPGVCWERTQTLGRGGDCCDFRWSRKQVI